MWSRKSRSKVWIQTKGLKSEVRPEIRIEEVLSFRLEAEVEKQVIDK